MSAPLVWYSATDALPKPIVQQLQNNGVQLVQSPVMQIEPWLDRTAGLHQSIHQQATTHLLLTSPHACATLPSLQLPPELPIVLVGVEIIMTYTQLGLTNLTIEIDTIEQWLNSQTGPVHLLHLCGRHVPPLLQEAIGSATSYLPYPIYDSKLLDALPTSVTQALDHRRSTYITLHSVMAANGVRQLLAQQPLAHLPSILCANTEVAGRLPPHLYAALLTAQEPTADSMHSLMLQQLHKSS